MPTFRSQLSTAQQREYSNLGPGEQKAFRKEYNRLKKSPSRAELRPSFFKQSEGFYNPASGPSEP